MKTSEGKKVFVGVSGGVDSSVSLALLQEQGYDVTGVFIKTWQPEWIECTWRDERRDAMRVCAHLGVDFVTLDLEKAYKEGVADYMIAEYRSGRTPNPDVMCNKEVKFGGFLDWALENGADYIATGHYTRNSDKEGRQRMLEGKDKNKDQSYFLWTLTQDQLKHTIFPIGDIPKPKVRELAEKFNLPTASKKDSQGVCFIGEIDMKDFLGHYIDEKNGDVLNTDGEVIGEHNGAFLLTIGERHGFTISKKGTEDKALFVVEKDADKNTVTVSEKSPFDEKEGNTAGYTKEVSLIKTNWIPTAFPPFGKDFEARVRYRGERHKCNFMQVRDDTALLVFENPVWGVSAGQSVVVYDKEECIGGGIIS
ncbi:MAG: tRNA-specific 2-thiouridylase [Candidatus Paceibacteria bacterium]|jgi:tRNA-specific 2-thiouridylase